MKDGAYIDYIGNFLNYMMLKQVHYNLWQCNIHDTSF